MRNKKIVLTSLVGLASSLVVGGTFIGTICNVKKDTKSPDLAKNEVLIDGTDFNMSAVDKSCSQIIENTLYIPDTCTSISGVLNSNLSINRIVFHADVTKIIGNPFVDCENIIDVTIASGNTSFEITNGMLVDKKAKKLISSFEAILPSGIVIPPNVETIGTEAFYANSRLRKVIVPITVKKIEINAFGLCANLTNIKLPTTFHRSEFEASGQYNIGINADQWAQINWVNASDNLEYYAFDLSNITRYSEFVNGSVLTVPNTYYQIVGQLNPNIEIDTVIFQQKTPITSIPSEAFRNCKFLSNVVLPTSIESIGAYAFSGCTLLKSVNILEKNTSSLTTIGTNAFNHCTNLVNVVLPDIFKNENSTEEGSGANDYGFSAYQWKNINWNGVANQINFDLSTVRKGHPYLEGRTLTIPSNITNLLGSLNPDLRVSQVIFEENSKITQIPDNAFLYCEDLTNINLPEGITNIGNNAFQKCVSLKNPLLPNTLKTIGDYAFAHCYAITEATLPDSLTSLGVGAFDSCNKLASINLGNIRDIAAYTFSMCTSLATITHSTSGNNSLRNVGEFAFFKTDITQIAISEGTTTIQNDAFNGMPLLTNITLPSTLTTIGDHAFDNCIALNNVTLPESLTALGAGAFFGCSALTAITIPVHLQNIKDYTFMNCVALATITVNSNVTEIGANAFNNCQVLTSYKFDEHITTIKDNAFKDCVKLNNVKILPEMTTMGSGIFDGCTSLTNVFVKQGVTALPAYVFKNCTSLVSVTIPESCATLNNGVFSGCSTFTTLTAEATPTDPTTNVVSATGTSVFEVPTTVTRYGNYVFEGCSAIISVNLNNLDSNITKVPNGMFKNCDGLTTISIPQRIVTLGDSCFSECDKIASLTYIGQTSSGNTSVPGTDAITSFAASSESTTQPSAPTQSTISINIPSGITTIEARAFKNCVNINNLDIPTTVTTLGEEAFVGCKRLKYAKLNQTETSNHLIGANLFTYDTIVPNNLVIDFASTNVRDTFKLKTGVTPSSTQDKKNWYYFDEVNNVANSENGNQKPYPNQEGQYLMVMNRINYDLIEEQDLIDGTLEVRWNVYSSFGWLGNLSKFLRRFEFNSIRMESFGGTLNNFEVLETVTCADNVIVTEVPNNMFRDSNKLTSVTLPASINRVGVSAFLSTADNIQVIFKNPELTNFGKNVFTWHDTHPKQASIQFASDNSRTAFLNAHADVGQGNDNNNRHYFEIDPTKPNGQFWLRLKTTPNNSSF